MVYSFVERELKFDVGPRFVLPDVSALLPDGGRLETVTEQLQSDYFDTADQALTRAGVTLRHRSGSTDVGWQLKVPFGDFREEIRSDEPAEGVPDELSTLLYGIRRGRALTRIARLVTVRTVTRLLASDGSRLAEFDDDTVHAAAATDVTSSGGTATATTWRELEIELGTGDLDLLKALAKAARVGGARPSTVASKLARALDEPAAGRPARRPRTADVIAGYVAEQQRAILIGDIALRRGHEDVVHQTRVATRRLRSTLRVFGPLFDAPRAATLDAELRWYAGALGEVRDREVLRKRLDGMVANLDDTLLLGPVRQHIDTELRREQSEHWQRLQDDLIGPRYLALLEDLSAWVAQPPWTPKARRPAKIVQDLSERADRLVFRTLRRANAAGDVHRLHSARKAAKRARYAAEAAAPVVGRHASKRIAKRYQRLQDLLGEHQDSLLSAAVLRRLGAVAGTTEGENGFSFGILYEREMANAARVRDEARRVAKQYG
jgi:CHAD domain-containing protein